jgi:hypothetical protein
MGLGKTVADFKFSNNVASPAERKKHRIFAERYTTYFFEGYKKWNI